MSQETAAIDQTPAPARDESAVDDVVAGDVGTERPSTWARELGTISALWRRDMMRLRKAPSRWLGIVAQPLLFWAIIGTGMAQTFTLPGASGDVDYLTYFYPGILVMIVLFTAIFGTIGVIEDRQSGFLQAVVAAPVSRVSIVAGKVLGVTTLAGIQSAIFILLAPAAGYPLSGIAWGPLLVVLLLSAIGLTSLGLVGAWVMRSTQAYHAVMSVVLLPLWVVSGAMFPPHGRALEIIMAANPMRYTVDGLRRALGSSAAVAESSAAVDIGTSIAVLAGFAFVSLLLAARVARRRGRS